MSIEESKLTKLCPSSEPLKGEWKSVYASDERFRGREFQDLSYVQCLFERCDFSSTTFKNCEFQDTCFYEGSLDACKFVQCSFTRVSFVRSVPVGAPSFRTCSFDSSQFDCLNGDIAFEYCEFTRFRFVRSPDRRVGFNEELKKPAEETKARPPHVIITQCKKLVNSQFINCDLFAGNTGGGFFIHTELSGGGSSNHAEVSGSYFVQCNFRGHKFINISMRDMGFSFCSLQGVKFSRATLDSCIFLICDLRDACFQKAVFSNSVYNNVVMDKNTNFSDSDLAGLALLGENKLLREVMSTRSTVMPITSVSSYYEDSRAFLRSLEVEIDRAGGEIGDFDFSDASQFTQACNRLLEKYEDSPCYHEPLSGRVYCEIKQGFALEFTAPEQETVYGWIARVLDETIRPPSQDTDVRKAELMLVALALFFSSEQNRHFALQHADFPAGPLIIQLTKRFSLEKGEFAKICTHLCRILNTVIAYDRNYRSVFEDGPFGKHEHWNVIEYVYEHWLMRTNRPWNDQRETLQCLIHLFMICPVGFLRSLFASRVELQGFIFNSLRQGSLNVSREFKSVSQESDLDDCCSQEENKTIVVRSLCYVSKGGCIIAGCSDGVIRAWTPIERKSEGPPEYAVRLFTGHKGKVNCVVASTQTASEFASAGDDKTIRFWDVETNTCRLVISKHSGCVNALSFSPKGTEIVSGSDDRAVRLWDTKTGEMKSNLTSHSERVTCVDFHPDGVTVVSGSDDRGVRVWNSYSGLCLYYFREHLNPIVAVRFSKDGNFVASSSSDKTTRVWSLEKRTCIDVLTELHVITGLTSSGEGDQLIHSCSDGTLSAFDPTKFGRLKSKLPFKCELESPVAAITSHDNRLITATTGGVVRVHSSTLAPLHVVSDCLAPVVNENVGLSLAPVSRLDAKEEGNTGKESRDKDKEEVKGEAYDPDSWSGKSLIWKRIRMVNGNRIRQALLTPDEKYCIVLTERNAIQRWSVVSCRNEGQFTGQTEDVLSMCVSSDSSRLITGCRDSTVRVWMIESLNCIATLNGNHSPGATVMCVACSPDGKWFASGDDLGIITVWNAHDNTVGKELRHNGCRVLCATFSPDSTLLATAGDGRPVIRSTASGKLQMEQEGYQICLWECKKEFALSRALSMHRSSVCSLAFSPDSRTIASLDVDRNVFFTQTQEHKDSDRECPVHVQARIHGEGLAFFPRGDRVAVFARSADESLSISLATKEQVRIGFFSMSEELKQEMNPGGLVSVNYSLPYSMFATATEVVIQSDDRPLVPLKEEDSKRIEAIERVEAAASIAAYLATNGENAMLFINSGIIPVVKKAMFREMRSPYVVQKLCVFYKNICVNNGNIAHMLAFNASVFDDLSIVFNYNLMLAPVMEAACSAVMVITLFDGASRALGRALLPHFRNVFDNHKTVWQVMQHWCGALANIALGPDLRNLIVEKYEFHKDLAFLMRTYKTNPYVSQYACAFLMAISLDQNNAVANREVFLNDVEFIVRNHKAVASVMQNAFSAVMALAGPASSKLVIAKRFAGLMKAALETHMEQSNVVEWIVGCILTMTVNDEALGVIKQLENIHGLVQTARNNHTANQNIQSWTFRILARLNQ